MKKYLLVISGFLTFVLLMTTLLHSSRELDQDLGRHIKLGEIVLHTHKVPNTNLFSYTHPDFPFLNHHWGSEVIFALLANTFGVAAISYLKILVFLASITFILLAARRYASWPSTFFVTTFTLPLLISRTLDRPEMFGYLFFCLYLFLYTRVRKRSRGGYLFLIPFVAFLWINLHISFVYGFVLLAIFFVDTILKKDFAQAKTIVILTIVSGFVSLLNPHGLSGLLYPLSIFKNYGYSIQENQNLFFLASLTSNIFISYFWIVFWSITLIVIFRFIKAIRHNELDSVVKNDFLYFSLFVTFSILSISAIRNFPFFAFAAIFTGPYFLDKLLVQRKRIYLPLAVVTICTQIFLIIFISTNFLYRTLDLTGEFGLSTKESYKQAADFFLSHTIPGPIFNNFDIGGYLDYRLYPKHQVFVDNRPEAYPVAFFEEYKNSQSNPELMTKLFSKYHVQSVIFSHTDATDWGRGFMENMQKYKDFKLVYLDPDAFILVKKSVNLPELTEKDFERLIADTNDYRDLYSLSFFMSSLKKRDLAQKALVKSYEANPHSCATRVNYGLSLLGSPNLPLQKQGLEIVKSTWYCPFPPYIKDNLKKILSGNFNQY